MRTKTGDVYIIPDAAAFQVQPKSGAEALLWRLDTLDLVKRMSMGHEHRHLAQEVASWSDISRHGSACAEIRLRC